MPKKVTKAVIAAAGFGTRFLPQTKAMPKEMLPLIDKPIIQYVVEELVEAGIKDIIIVTGYHKRSIEDHFDQMSADLRENLEQGHKAELLEQTKSISHLANFAYVRQKGSYGSATPLLNIAHLIGDEPFIYTFADDLIPSEPNRFTQMMKLYDEFQCTILPCRKLEEEAEYGRYGVVSGEVIREGVLKLDGIVEKPGSKDKAPSDMGSIGGYLLTPEIFPYINKAADNLPVDKEFYLTTYGLEPMLKDHIAMYGCTLTNSKYYDTGNKLEYLKTVVDYALKRDDIGPDFKAYLHTVLN
ncbi:MAG: UTP--glucose-phosphate uridylyltransferase [Candidatus Saccharibacteria bacterium]|nr:UTP--glucose-phosphate uridylyltransferase [Candidatus Saccharibacteria bacterium]